MCEHRRFKLDIFWLLSNLKFLILILAASEKPSTLYDNYLEKTRQTSQQGKVSGHDTSGGASSSDVSYREDFTAMSRHSASRAGSAASVNGRLSAAAGAAESLSSVKSPYHSSQSHSDASLVSSGASGVQLSKTPSVTSVSASYTLVTSSSHLKSVTSHSSLVNQGPRDRDVATATTAMVATALKLQFTTKFPFSAYYLPEHTFTTYDFASFTLGAQY